MNQSKKNQKSIWTKKYIIKEIFLNTNLHNQTINYLKNQNYIDYKEIKEILKINYNKNYPIGYAIKIKNKIVGFAGTLLSKRKINKKNYLYCNIHTWVVDKHHRIVSHLLFLPLIKKKYIITVLSPQKRLVKTFEKMGFNIIDMNYKIVLLNFLLSFFHKNYLKFELTYSKIKMKLTKQDLQIYKDHSNPSFIRFVIVDKKNKSNFTFIVAKIVKKKRYFSVLNILYVSNINFFQKNWNLISIELFKVYKVLFCAQYFIKKKECIFPNKSKLSINFKKSICVKNLPKNFMFNTIYSEAI